jgi:hypothetical protein
VRIEHGADAAEGVAIAHEYSAAAAGKVDAYAHWVEHVA